MGALGNLGQAGIGEIVMDHHGTLLRAFSTNDGMGLAIVTKILTLLEGLKLAKAKSLFDLLVERFCNSHILGKYGEKLVEVC